MPMYEFRCPACGVTSEMYLGLQEDLQKQPCRCGAIASRVYGFQIGRIDRTGDTDEVNLGLGKWFPNSKTREDWAKANGYEKLDW